MTRERETPGKFKSQQFNEKAYQAASRKDEANQFMRSFSRSKLKTRMQTYDSVFYTIVHGIILDVATTAGGLRAWFTNGWDKMWEYGHTKGNMKDLVAAQETALGLVCGNMLQIVWNLMAQNLQRSLLPSMTESDASGYWSQTSFDNFVNQLEGQVMPTFVSNFVKQFAFVIKMSDAYQLHSITVPPSYVLPWLSISQLAHEQARLLVVKANMANAIAQAEKYGIPMTKFSASMIDFIEVTDESSQARAFWNHCQYGFYAGEQVMLSPDGRMGTQSTTDDVALNMTTDYTNRKYFFPNNGPDCIIDALAPLLGTYDATNNLNGGWFTQNAVGAVAANTNIYYASHYATSLTVGTKATLGWYLMMILATWKGIAITDETPPSFVINIDTDVGTSVVGLNSELYWPYATYHQLFYGTGVTYAQSLDFMLSNLVRLTYGK
jgi:hypothetical protein